jgi:HEAT repeat protein
MSERTAFRRLESPEFKARVADLRAGMIEQAAGRLADGMTAAADVLLKLLTHRSADVRHKAAVKLLELGVRTNETADLGRRLADLEAELARPADQREDMA